MRKTCLKAFQVITVFLLLFLAVSTFIPQVNEFPPGEYPGAANRLIPVLHLDRLYGSPINIALWGLLALIIIAGILFKGIHTPIRKILHLLLALCFIVIAVEKSSNRRFNITIREGQEILFSDYTGTISEKHNLRIKLLQFEIQRHPDQRTPRAFISHLLINNQDTVQLAVNKPYAIERYRLYQSAYVQEFTFLVNIDDQVYTMNFGDSVSLTDGSFTLKDFDHQTRQFNLRVNDKHYHIGMKQPQTIGAHHVIINPGGTCYDSIIAVAEVRWIKLLLLLGLLYIVSLFIAFWYRSGTALTQKVRNWLTWTSQNFKFQIANTKI